MRRFGSIFLSVFLTSQAITALPADNALAQLEGRGTCNADNCLRFLTNRPSDATAYCTSLLGWAPKAATITSWVSSTTTPGAATVTQLIGTTTTTTALTSTYTSDQTVLDKRVAIVTTLPVSALIPLSCTSSAGAPVTARASSACSCLLSTSATVTVTSTSILTLPTPTVTQTTSNAATSTTTLEAVVTSISTTTSTASSAAATETAILYFGDNYYPGDAIIYYYGELTWDQLGEGLTTEFGIIPAGGQPFLADSPDLLLYGFPWSDNFYFLGFDSNPPVSDDEIPVSCSVSSGGVMTCSSLDGVFNTLYASGAAIFIGKPDQTEYVTPVTFVLSSS